MTPKEMIEKLHRRFVYMQQHFAHSQISEVALNFLTSDFVIASFEDLDLHTKELFGPDYIWASTIIGDQTTITVYKVS